VLKKRKLQTQPALPCPTSSAPGRQGRLIERVWDATMPFR